MNIRKVKRFFVRYTIPVHLECSTEIEAESQEVLEDSLSTVLYYSEDDIIDKEFGDIEQIDISEIY